MKPETSSFQAARLVAWVAAAIPLFELICFYGFVIRARMTLGFWPSPYHPDPKDLNFGVHYDVVMTLIITVGCGAVPIVLLSGVLWILIRRVSWWEIFLPVVASFGLALAIFVFDPGSFVEWFLD